MKSERNEEFCPFRNGMCNPGGEWEGKTSEPVCALFNAEVNRCSIYMLAERMADDGSSREGGLYDSD